mgnify:FL=1
MNPIYYQSFSATENPVTQLLFIHGWGMNSGIWTDLIPRLSAQLPDYEFTVVDLPGYGKSPAMVQESTSLSLAEALRPLVKAKLRKKNIILGWSMGGLIAIELASIFTEHIHQLVLVSATPRFVQADNWSEAVEAKLFLQFLDSLEKDHSATLKRFLAIQALGSPTAKQDIKQIQQQLSQQGGAKPSALRQGLQILLNEDKRIQLLALSIPVICIAGQRDTLIKVKALELLTETPNIYLHTMAAAGHAPFISHPQQFVELLLKAL